MIIGLTPDSINGFLKVLSLKDFDEPVSSFNELDLKKLSSTLKTPFLRPQEKINNQEEILRTAAHLFCLMVESHYAINGNKRLAVVSLYTFLKLNGYILKTSEVRLYAIAMAVTWLSKYGLFQEAKEEVFLFLSGESVLNKGPKINIDERKKLQEEFIRFMQSRS